MGIPVEKRRHTISEYLRLERESVEKHEYRDGEILAMAGGSPNHSLITANFIRELGNVLKGKPCRVYDSNLRVLIPRTPLYTYPDASVLCSEPKLDPQDEKKGTITDPRLLAEVLSASTEAYDRGEKFTRYRQIDSLQEYVLISQHTPRVEMFFRRSDGTWLFTAVAGLESIARLTSLEIAIPLREIYAGVEFETVPEIVESPSQV
jgi:Uma2 family endonuclease